MIHALPTSDVGRMIKYGHHKGGMIETLPADRHCEDCGAECGSYEATKLCLKAEMIHIEVMRREVNAVVDNFAKVKSGSKIKKKINQMYGRDVKHLSETLVDQRLKDFNEKLCKPKPKYLPKWIWKPLRAIVLRDKIMV